MNRIKQLLLCTYDEFQSIIGLEEMEILNRAKCYYVTFKYPPNFYECKKNFITFLLLSRR